MTNITIEKINIGGITAALSTMLNKKNDDELIKIKATKIFKYFNIQKNLKRFNVFYKNYGQKMSGGKKKKTRKKKSLKKNSKKRRRIKKRSRKGGNLAEYGVAFFIIVFAFYGMDFIPDPENTSTTTTNTTTDTTTTTHPEEKTAVAVVEGEEGEEEGNPNTEQKTAAAADQN
jgi:cytoskeletal protein RodZ